MNKEQLLRKFTRFKSETYLINEEWDCDILSIQSSIINEYIEAYGREDKTLGLSAKFLEATLKPKKLKDLLSEDLEYLIAFNPELNHLNEKIHFEESSEKIPRVSVLYAEGDEYLIVFNKSIINLLHFFYGVAELLCERVTYLDKYISDNVGDKSDKNLIGSLMDRIHNYYLRETEASKNDAANLEDVNFSFFPFNYCEKVIAGRRFLLAHELAHIFLKHPVSFDPALPYNQFNKVQEYEADAFGMYFLFNCFESIDSMDFSDFCNLENHLSGITQIFLLYDMIEGFHEWYKEVPDHPKAYFREMEAYTNLTRMIIGRFNDSFFLIRYLTVVMFENQIIKGMPYNLVIQELGAAGGALFSRYNKITREEIEALVKDKKLQDIVIYLTDYQPYDQSKFKDLDSFETDALFKFNKFIFGEEFGAIVTEDLISGNTTGPIYDTVVWPMLLRYREDNLKYLIQLKNDSKKGNGGIFDFRGSTCY